MAVMVLLWATCAIAADPPMVAAPQFRLYSIAEGLSQKTVSGVAQDLDGFLWIATFGGLNRFDGRRFETFTANDGLRQNLIQAVMTDSHGRVWAGDAAGGLSLLEDGAVKRTFKPDDAVRGVARALVTIGDFLYFGTQPGGIRRLDLRRMEAGFEAVAQSPDEIVAMAADASDRLFVLTPDRLYRYLPAQSPAFEVLVEGASALASDASRHIAVGPGRRCGSRASRGNALGSANHPSDRQR